MELAGLNMKELRARARVTPAVTEHKTTADGRWVLFFFETIVALPNFNNSI